jgi:hypothetical protein
MREHRCLLNQGKHLCKKLQADWNADRESGFEVLELERLPDTASVVDKRIKELHWMQVHSEKLYNEHQVSFAPVPSAILKGIAASARFPRPQTPEANEKRRIALLGRKHDRGPKISATKKALGQRPSLEAARAGGRAAHLKRKMMLNNNIVSSAIEKKLQEPQIKS